MKLVLLPKQWIAIKKALGYTEKKMKQEFIKGGFIPKELPIPNEGEKNENKNK